MYLTDNREKRIRRNNIFGEKLVYYILNYYVTKYYCTLLHTYYLLLFIILNNNFD